MNDTIESSGEKQYDSFGFSKEENGKEIRVNARECDNGWVIDINRSWYDKMENGTKEYRSSSEQFISSRDPREVYKDKAKGLDTTKNPELKTEFDTTSLINSIGGSDGLIIVKFVLGTLVEPSEKSFCPDLNA